MIRKILVPVRGDGKGDNVLAHAAALAHRYGAHIEVVHCRPRPEDLMPYGIPIPEFLKGQLLKQSYEVADQEEAGLRRELEVLADRLKLDPSDASIGKAATVSFVEERGRQVEVIKRRGRLADLIAVAKPDRDRNLGFNTLKAALFNSGRPVLMCPPRAAAPSVAPEALGARVALAWNGSAEAARALSQCMGILRQADAVWVLSNGEDAGPGTAAEDLAGYLRLHGISATVERFEADRRVGRQLLSASAALGADMLLMGAYGDSHERETVFGGNTQTVVDTATMPVLFNH
jgi:nucleotide-binding universal stress UspA family protein